MEQIQPLQGTPNLKRDHRLIFILGSIPCIQVRFSKPFKSALGSLTWKQRWMFLNSHPKFLRTNCTWLYFGFKTKYFNIWTTYFNIIIITLLFWHASKSCQNEDECCCTASFTLSFIILFQFFKDCHWIEKTDIKSHADKRVSTTGRWILNNWATSVTFCCQKSKLKKKNQPTNQLANIQLTEMLPSFRILKPTVYKCVKLFLLLSIMVNYTTSSLCLLARFFGFEFCLAPWNRLWIAMRTACSFWILPGFHLMQVQDHT